MAEPWLIALVAAACGVAAWALTGWMLRIAETDSRLYRGPLHVFLAALGGVGATVIAQNWADVVTFGLLAVGAALLFVIDLAEERLPNALNYPLYLLLIGGLAVSAWLSGDWPRFWRAMIAGAVVFALFFALAMVGPLYFGDVMLSGLIGGFLGWFGWAQVMLGVFSGFLIHALIGLTLMALKRANRSTEFAFGPWMILGAVIGVAFGPAVFPAFS